MSLQKWQETLITAQVDGTAKTAIAIGTILPGAAKYTLYAGFFEIGRVIRIRASGKISNVVTTPGTARFSVVFSSGSDVTVFDSQAVPLNTTAKTDVGWDLEIVLTCRVIGTAAALIGIGWFRSEAVVGGAAVAPITVVLPYNTTPANGNTFDSTAAQTIDLRHTQTVATGSITLQQYVLESVN